MMNTIYICPDCGASLGLPLAQGERCPSCAYEEPLRCSECDEVVCECADTSADQDDQKWAGKREASIEIAQAILQLAHGDAFTARRIWDSPTGDEEREIWTRAWKIASENEDTLHWGVETHHRPAAAGLEKTIGFAGSGGGYYAEVYDEETDRVGRWYGTREQCEAIDPSRVELYERVDDESADQFDLACERRND